ncbi:helix-turn-helix domain-containing protein [Streptomyces sp. bgisy027]|uniref:PucR family transcriptional regulator n=1 Tax=Streptomyces sp. bgisy027 TaxID=3413770 RepID=UPI003D722DB1
MPDPAVPPTPPVALSALLARADLGLRQIAGPTDRDTVIHWAHTSEMADPYPYLLGGELLLSAGVHIPEAAGSDGGPPCSSEAESLGDYFDAYVSRIVAAGGAALGFGLAPVHDTVPRALVEACDTYELPLLEVPPQTTFSGVARAVWQLMAQARHAELRRVTEAQQSLAAAASRPDPVRAVLRQLAQRVGGWAVLYGPEGTESAPAPPGTEGKPTGRGPETTSTGQPAETTGARRRTAAPTAGPRAEGVSAAPGPEDVSAAPGPEGVSAGQGPEAASAGRAAAVTAAGQGPEAASAGRAAAVTAAGQEPGTTPTRQAAAAASAGQGPGTTPTGQAAAGQGPETTPTRQAAAAASAGQRPETTPARQAAAAASAGQRPGTTPTGQTAAVTAAGQGPEAASAGRAGEVASAGREPGDVVRGALAELAAVVRPSGPGTPTSATDTAAGTHLAAYALGAGQGFVLGVAAPQRDTGDHTIASVAAVLLSLLTGEHQSGSGAARSSALVRLLLGAEPQAVAPLLGGDGWLVVHGSPDAQPCDPVAAAALGAALGSPLVDLARDVVRVLVPADREPAPQPGWTLGVSAPASARDWPAADTQAARALSRARATRTPLHRHGTHRPALTDLLSPGTAEAHARALLAPLTPPLAETLRTWLSLHGSWDRTAVALAVHRNTVRRRIARCSAALGTDLDDPDVRMELWFALRHGER